MLAISPNPISGIAHTGRPVTLPAGAYEVVDINGAADRNVAVVRGPDGLLVTIATDDPHTTFAEPGSPFHNPDLPAELCLGFVVGTCGHRVAGSEWAAGLRTCERC